MNSTLSDDDLGALLRTALQDVSPLATDPVPPPRFAPAARLLTAVPPVEAASSDDVVELREPVARTPRSTRRTVAAVAVLAAAAAVVTAVVTLDRPGGGDRVAPAGPSSNPVVVPSFVLTPPAGATWAGVNVWRCTAPAGQVIGAALQSDPIYREQVWEIASGVDCGPQPDEAGKYVLTSNGVTVPGESPPWVATSGTCVTAGSSYQGQPPPPSRDLAVRSEGAASYLEFFGPGCYLLLPSR